MFKIMGLGAALAAAGVAGALWATPAAARLAAQVCGPYLVTGDTGGRGTRFNPQYLALTPLGASSTDGVDWFVTVLQNSRKRPNRYANSGAVLSLTKGRLVDTTVKPNKVHPCRNAKPGEITVAVTQGPADDQAPAGDQAANDATSTASAYGPGGMEEPSEMSEFPVDVPGRALGGRMRAEPGMGGAAVTSLAEGTRVTITHGTPEWMNGYLWYGVEANGRRGYVWGGILCAPGQNLPGMFPCP